ncbi:MAG TPA: ABC transporter ATP-binding protein [Spirochaetota bacterium]|nr:ABC transporter ATP-binding protein [Spirochaetota bacterium]HPJ41434.1 ABC transporter ATP-binding protein [Spirochaetota bacterium]HPR36465.1 ABC transporter ATP-binding protein [Spirochaetota bacterium]
MSEELFRITEADAGYRGNCFIRSLSLSVKKGDFISLIGPNGAGKSTIIKLLSGLLSPFSGKVEFTGTDIRDIGNRELAKSFSVVGQISGEIPDFSVKNFISLGRFPFFDILEGNTADNSYIEMASRTGVTRLLDRSIRELSAGEFQLVQVTRALVQNNKILLLDEPVSNLDYQHIVRIMDILKNLHNEGTTIICALHDVNAAMDYCSRVVAIKDGGVFFDGVPDKVINQNSMKSLYETEFYCGINPVTGRPLVLPVPGGFS